MLHLFLFLKHILHYILLLSLTVLSDQSLDLLKPDDFEEDFFIKKEDSTFFDDGKVANHILNEECLSIVGSRNCTEYGAKMARKFAMELAREWCCDSKWNGKWNR